MGLFSSNKPEPKPEPPQESEEDKRLREEREYMEAFWPKYLHRGKILESWAAMVDGGKGQYEEFINRVVDRVVAVKIPDLKAEVRGLFFDTSLQQSQMFFVFWRNVEPLHVCKMFIGVQDYGENMSVSWYLLWDGNPWTIHPDNNNAGKVLYNLIFEAGHERALKDWVGIVHKIILDETKQTMSSLNLDFSKIDVHTNGFLNLP